MTNEELNQRLAERRTCEAEHGALMVPHSGFGWTGSRCSQCGFSFFEKWEPWADPLRSIGVGQAMEEDRVTGMVELVARALARENADERGVGWKDFESEARAAIKAMRDFNTEDFTLTEAAGIRRLIDEALEGPGDTGQT